MDLPPVIPFAIAGIVLLWALWGTMFAFRGGTHSGLPLILEPPEVREEPANELDHAE